MSTDVELQVKVARLEEGYAAVKEDTVEIKASLNEAHGRLSRMRTDLTGEISRFREEVRHARAEDERKKREEMDEDRERQLERLREDKRDRRGSRLAMLAIVTTGGVSLLSFATQVGLIG